MNIITVLEVYMTVFLPLLAIVAGIAGAMVLSRFIIGSIVGAFTLTEKKSYEDEMSHYDEQEVEAIQSLPDKISLSELVSDGEIPDSAFETRTS